MRVAVISEQLRRRVPGGIGTYVRGLLGASAELAEAGIRVQPRQWRLPVPVVTRAWEHGFLGGTDRFDVVHAPALAFPPTRRPLVVTVHGLEWRDPEHRAPERGRRWHEAALARAVRDGALLLASNAELASTLRADGAMRVTTLDGPMYGADHLPPPDEDAARALLDRVGVTGRFLLSVGTLEPRKNLPRLVEAYRRARADIREPLPLLLVGPAGWGEGLAPTEGVVLTGPVDDAVLAALYAWALAVAYVPLHEGFGLPAVEAMRAGAPVIASRVPSVGEAALLVEPTDVDDIAMALVRVTRTLRERNRLIAAGAAHTADLTWAKAAERHGRLWLQLARGTR
jgi:glycosyltransferase involved in cell wall biosynthesis